MISADYCRLMARYNTWQNTSLVTAADTLNNQDRKKDRGAFFGSISATFNHLYWADALMLARLTGNERPQKTITHSLTNPSDWTVFKSLRTQRDAQIETWANTITDAEMRGHVGWFPPDGSEKIEMSKQMCIVQMFNHQTHHRGQIHAMLTAAGAAPDVTDLPALPD